jgi:hypothetical protein
MRPLPRLPGETILWQERPAWRPVARSVFHIRMVALYFGLLIIADIVANRLHGLSPLATLRAELPLVALAAGAGAVLLVLAWLTARTTDYTITDRRVVLRFGVAFPATLSLPLRVIGSVAVRVHPDHTGDIPLVPRTGERVSYLKLWPLARPWRLARPQPMLRAVPRAGMAAALLSRTLATAQRDAVASLARHDDPTAAAAPAAMRGAALDHAT